MDSINIRGARVHNLKNIDVSIPRNKLVVITGLSGSGKSSLAFDTIYAEGQRRYVESLSAYARQFLSLMEKPDVDHIEGLSPAISIEQKATSHNPRSTVGTITEIYDYLRLLFARVGSPRCPDHGDDLQAQTISQMVDAILDLPEDEKIMILAPIVKNRKGSHLKLLQELSHEGFLRARVDGEVMLLEEIEELDGNKNHTIEIVIDRLKVRQDITSRLSESLETALNMSAGIAIVCSMEIDSSFKELTFSAKFSCIHCGYSLDELEPRLFSFNNPVGACETCDGLGIKDVFDEERVVANPELSLEDGAIYGWSKSNAYFYQMLTLVGNYYNFSISTPFNELSDENKKIVLYGSGNQVIDFSKIKGRRGWTSKKKPFEGIIPRMMRRYADSDIRSIREELSRYVISKPCSSCHGDRLNSSARNVFIDDRNISDITKLTIDQVYDFFDSLQLDGQRGEIASKILSEISQRLHFLINVGLDYLNLERKANSLSGGEAQRIRLASQIGAGLIGVLYVLDEPSIGLHQRDNQKLLDTLTYLRDLGNTVIVVEHDEDAIRQADYVVDIGPGAGIHGGEIVAIGPPDEVIANTKSLTGDYLSGRLEISIPKTRKKSNGWLNITGASGNNLKHVDLKIPVGVLTCITGVSGSGKSSLVSGILAPALQRHLHNADTIAGKHTSMKGLEHVDKAIIIDQSPIGRTPRSNPATYTKVFDEIRILFSKTTLAKERGYTPGHFSFNVKGGRCESCKGAGSIKLEMNFLPDVWITCDVCQGLRYTRECLEVTWKGKNINDILQMPIGEAVTFFENHRKIFRTLDTLRAVGLSYVRLGQPATTLSGGEAQRVKLASELRRPPNKHTVYILDEPTTGLSFSDVELLINVLLELRAKGHSVIVIEHHLDVIKSADWVIDLGPEGGERGGMILAQGTPEDVAANPESFTGQYLAKLLS